MPRTHPGLPWAALLPMALLFGLVLAFGAVRPVLAVFATPSADLSGDQEVPATDSTATGSIDLTIDTDQAEPGSQLCYDMVVEDLAEPVTAAHIHAGAAGTAAPDNIVVTLHPDATGLAEAACATDADINLANACAPTVSALLEDLAVNPQNYYVNVHTASFPNGEIRGQLSTEVGDEPENVGEGAPPLNCAVLPSPADGPTPPVVPADSTSCEVPIATMEALGSFTTLTMLEHFRSMTSAGLIHMNLSPDNLQLTIIDMEQAVEVTTETLTSALSRSEMATLVAWIERCGLGVDPGPLFAELASLVR